MRKHTQLSDITAAEVARLRKLSEYDLSPLGLVKRCNALLALLDNKTPIEPAAQVEKWKQRFFRAGFRGWFIDINKAYNRRLETVLRKEAEVINCVCDTEPPATHDYWPLEEVAKHLRIDKAFVNYVFDRYGILFSDTQPESERGSSSAAHTTTNARHRLFEKLDSHRAGANSNWSELKQKAFFEAIAAGNSVPTSASIAGLSMHQINTQLEQSPEFEMQLKRAEAGPISEVEAALYKRCVGYDYEEKETGITEKGERSITRYKQKEPDVKAIEIYLTNRHRNAWSSKPKEATEAKGVSIGICDSTREGNLPELGGESPTDEELAGIE